jgi:hypothetical protein
MANLPANPLQSLISAASRSLPKHTGLVDSATDRINRLGNSEGSVILADVSGSMEAPAWGGRSKHEVLRDALAEVMRAPANLLVAFSTSARVLQGVDQLPAPRGSTALHIGLRAAMAQDKARILAISDGEPNDEAAALAEAADFGGVIDVLYIGPDSNAAAMGFLRRLARAGHGRFHGSDISKAGQPALTTTVRGLLR